MSLDFVAIDFETANPSRASVCQLGAVIVRDGKIIDQQDWMIYPPTGLMFTNTWVHGICAEDVADAPIYPEVLREFDEWSDGCNALVSYGAFDRGAMTSANRFVGLPEPDFEFFDALTLARRVLDLDGYKLPRVAEALGLEGFKHHDALADALVCAQLVPILAARAGFETCMDLWAGTKPTRSHKPRTEWKLPTPNLDANRENPLFGACVCFSGGLDHFSRRQAQVKVASLGAKVTSTPTKHTDLLVEGKFDRSTFAAGANMSAKVSKALDLARKGQSIEIIDEETFVELVRFCESFE